MIIITVLVGTVCCPYNGVVLFYDTLLLKFCTEDYGDLAQKRIKCCQCTLYSKE